MSTALVPTASTAKAMSLRRALATLHELREAGAVETDRAWDIIWPTVIGGGTPNPQDVVERACLLEVLREAENDWFVFVEPPSADSEDLTWRVWANGFRALGFGDDEGRAIEDAVVRVAVRRTGQEEVWKAIPGYDGLYEASSLGRIRSVPRTNVNSIGIVRLLAPRILAPRQCSGGHVGVSIYKHNQKRYVQVHTLVLEAFVGPRPAGMECRHLNGHPADNRPCNLEWGTRKANEADKKRHKTHKRGAEHHKAKLTQEQREIIIATPATYGSASDLAHRFGVSTTTISNVRREARLKGTKHNATP